MSSARGNKLRRRFPPNRAGRLVELRWHWKHQTGITNGGTRWIRSGSAAAAIPEAARALARHGPAVGSWRGDVDAPRPSLRFEGFELPDVPSLTGEDRPVEPGAVGPAGWPQGSADQYGAARGRAVQGSGTERKQAGAVLMWSGGGRLRTSALPAHVVGHGHCTGATSRFHAQAIRAQRQSNSSQKRTRDGGMAQLSLSVKFTRSGRSQGDDRKHG
jgi:hypothetical protein